MLGATFMILFGWHKKLAQGVQALWIVPFLPSFPGVVAQKRSLWMPYNVVSLCHFKVPFSSVPLGLYIIMMRSAQTLPFFLLDLFL